MRVVAEGVEDNETADALQELGTDLLQGYWFSKPVTEAEFRKLL
jgi:EAL domain-containing protein (putative c-di-GMP-specific phosphodiesterase class I)